MVYLSGAGLLRLSWKKGRLTDVVVVVVSAICKTKILFWNSWRKKTAGIWLTLVHLGTAVKIEEDEEDVL